MIGPFAGPKEMPSSIAVCTLSFGSELAHLFIKDSDSVAAESKLRSLGSFRIVTPSSSARHLFAATIPDTCLSVL